MSEFEIKENKGSIWKNDYKNDNEKAPDYKGKINVDGTIKQISLWVNKTEGGKSYFGVQIENEYIKEDSVNNDTTEHNADNGSNEDDLPF